MPLVSNWHQFTNFLTEGFPICSAGQGKLVPWLSSPDLCLSAPLGKGHFYNKIFLLENTAGFPL